MTTSQVSIIVSDLETHPSLPRMLQSIGRQSHGLENTEIVIIGNGSHPASSQSHWQAITGVDSVTLFNVEETTTPAAARNLAAMRTSGELLIFMRPDYRMDPKYLTTIFSIGDKDQNADIIYSDYIRLASKQNASVRPSMIQLPNYDDNILQQRNILGPCVLIRREAFERTQGFRENTLYREWDMWIQAANTGSSFFHVDYPLASCEHYKVPFKERAEDGRSKAMIVINNQSYFHPHAVRWALAYLRGESWTHAFGFMTIPSPMDVTRMLHEFNMKKMGTDAIAREAIRQFDLSPLTIEASR